MDRAAAKLSFLFIPNCLSAKDLTYRLALADGRKAEVVELKYFGGLTNIEAADALGISVATVERDWDVAKLWLLRELGEGKSNDK